MGVFQTFSKDYDARAVRMSARRRAGAARDARRQHAWSSRSARTAQTDARRRTRWLGTLDPQAFEVRTWLELNDFYEKTVELYDRQFGVLQLIILLMVLLSVANSVNMSVVRAHRRVRHDARARQAGLCCLLAFVTENILLGVMGAVAGVVLGMLLALAISVVGIPMPPPPNANVGYTARIRLDMITVGVAAAIGVIAPVLASLWPAVRVARVPVVEALRASE